MPVLLLLIMLAAVLTLAWPVARFVSTSAQWLGYPYPRPGSEGLILYETMLVRQGGHPYVPITPEQFISGPYPPVYYWLASTVLPDQLPDFSTPYHVGSFFRSGRTISLVAALMAAALLPALVIFDGGYGRMGRRAVWSAALGGAVGGVLLLTLPQVMVWATRFRGDMLMVALTAAGLTCVASAVQPHQPDSLSPSIPVSSRSGVGAGTQSLVLGALQYTALVMGAVFFALALYTKQTALAGPLAAAAYLLIRDRRLGLTWCVLMAVLVLVPFAVLDIFTAHWFYLKMVEYHSLPLRLLTLTRLLQFAFWEDQWPLVLIAAAYVIYRLGQATAIFAGGQMWVQGQGQALGRLERLQALPMLVPMFALASCATLPTGAVVGADHNHLLIPGLAVSVGVGAALARLLCGLVCSWSDVAGKMAVPVAALLVGIYALLTSAPSPWYNADLLIPHPLVQEQLRLIVLNVRQHPASVFFSDDPGLIALAGKQTPYDDPFTMTALAIQGRWDESVFRRMLREGRFGLLVLSCDVINSPQECRSDIFTPGVQDAIRDGYQLLFRDVFYTYAPKAR